MKYRMLVGEPDDFHQIVFMKHLGILGYPVDKKRLVYADNCDDMVREAETGKFDIIFTEYRMPGKHYRNGLEAIEAIRSFDKKVPIVMITSVDKVKDDRDRERYIETVAREDKKTTNAVMKKPYSTEQLRRILEKPPALLEEF